MNKSRKQCSVLDPITKNWRRVKATDIGREVYDKKTGILIGVLVEPNPNTNMLRMQCSNGKIVTLKP